MGNSKSRGLISCDQRIDGTCFEHLKAVGEGTFGKVYAVRHYETGQVMAMKVMSKSKVVSSKSHMRAVWQERRVLTENSSPFLLGLTYAYQSETDLYLVIPYMHGGDLFKHFERLDEVVPVIPEKWLRYYVCELVLGLEDLHAINTIYRDLKPENVLVDQEGHIRLSDFGLCELLTPDKQYLTTGAVGTVKYIAPECRDGVTKYGKSCDYYSLGVLLVWMFQGHSDAARFLSNMESSYTPMSTAARSLTTALLQKHRRKRIGYVNAWDEVKRHPFFFGVDWGKVRRKEYKSPVLPVVPSWAQAKAPQPRTPVASPLLRGRHADDSLDSDIEDLNLCVDTKKKPSMTPSHTLGSPARHFHKAAAPPQDLPPHAITASAVPDQSSTTPVDSDAAANSDKSERSRQRYGKRRASITAAQQALFAAFAYQPGFDEQDEAEEDVKMRRHSKRDSRDSVSSTGSTGGRMRDSVSSVDGNRRDNSEPGTGDPNCNDSPRSLKAKKGSALLKLGKRLIAMRLPRTPRGARSPTGESSKVGEQLPLAQEVHKSPMCSPSKPIPIQYSISSCSGNRVDVKPLQATVSSRGNNVKAQQLTPSLPRKLILDQINP